VRRHHIGRVACAVRVVTDAEAFVAVVVDVVIMFIMFTHNDDDDDDDDDDETYSSVNTSHKTTRFLELLAFRGTLSYRARDCRVVE